MCLLSHMHPMHDKLSAWPYAWRYRLHPQKPLPPTLDPREPTPPLQSSVNGQCQTNRAVLINLPNGPGVEGGGKYVHVHVHIVPSLFGCRNLCNLLVTSVRNFHNCKRALSHSYVPHWFILYSVFMCNVHERRPLGSRQTLTNCNDLLAETRVVNAALAAGLPHIPRLLECLLFPQHKLNGGSA